MRTIVELTSDSIEELDKLRRQRGVSRTQLVREAVIEYLARNAGDTDESAFGLWRDRGAEDGLVYQERLRSEWDDARTL